MSTTMTRRSFMKTAAVTGAVGALGLGVAHNMAPSDKAWADNDVHEVRTSCRACIANCGVIATVSNGRVIKLRGDSIDPMSKGRMCPKGLSGIQALYHPNRNKYPMKRVGAKPGNQWERISWDEAAKTVAQHMIDMRDKTGKHGLLCTTGGGGNPQFFSPPRFRNFWGAGNVFEPGCAQCYLPRNFTMPLVNGIGDTSIADSGCSELYKPAKYGGLTEVYVIWGTGPAWHSPSTSGRCVAELRENGCKTVVVDPRFTADASKADVWLPIKPGTDMAMMLGWMHYIIENKLYEKIPGYETFCEQWTNLPFLVDPRDNVSLPPVAEDITKDGQLLRASAVFDDVDAANEGYVYFDTEKGEVTKAFALGPDNDGTYHPQMFGTVDVKLKDGSIITCKTAFEAYKDRCADFDLDTVAEITGCKKEKIIEAIELYCSSAHGGISLGVATDMYPGSAQAAIGAAALDCMTAHLWHSGCPANKVGGQGSKGLTSCESTIFPSGFIGDTKYEFQTNDAILERLGYCEHKGLGGWMHSHIPTVLSAVLTGEPYQPKVWIERSGNKMAALGNSSSWVDAFPKFDLIVHGYMYPTSFTTEAADIVFPVCEWLENAFAQNRLNVNLMRKPVTNLFEAADEIMMWGKIAEAMSDPSSELYDATHLRSIYPEITDYLTEKLQDPGWLSDLNERLEALAEAYETDNSLMRFHHYNPVNISRQFQKFADEVIPYQAREGFAWKEQQMFITQDEIDAFLVRGGAYSEGRLRTYSFYLLHEDEGSRTGFIKEQYGIGGSSHALSGADDSHANYDGKGLFLARGAYGNPYTSVLLSWNKVANRVAYLIKNDQFLQAEDYARMPEYEREQMANKVLRFYDRLPEEIDRPFTDDFFWEKPGKEMVAVLENPEQAEELLGRNMMQHWQFCH